MSNITDWNFFTPLLKWGFNSVSPDRLDFYKRCSFVLTKEDDLSFFLFFLLLWFLYTTSHLIVGQLLRPFFSDMAPQKHSSSGGSHPVGFGSGGKANGLYQSSSSAMAAAKKPNLQLIQADHELFLQAFESELLLSSSFIFIDISVELKLKVTGSFTESIRVARDRLFCSCRADLHT